MLHVGCSYLLVSRHSILQMTLQLGGLSSQGIEIFHGIYWVVCCSCRRRWPAATLTKWLRQRNGKSSRSSRTVWCDFQFLGSDQGTPSFYILLLWRQPSPPVGFRVKNVRMRNERCFKQIYYGKSSLDHCSRVLDIVRNLRRATDAQDFVSWYHYLKPRKPFRGRAGAFLPYSALSTTCTTYCSFSGNK
jgi:hypothetical protein